MAYATPADLAAVMGRSYATVYGAASANPDAVASVDVAASEAEINGYLAKRYQVPVQSAAALPLLKDWTIVLAMERAYSRASGQNDYTEKVKRRADEVRQTLKDAAEGTFALAADLAEAPGGAGVALVDCDPPVFGRRRMRGF